MQSFDEMFDSYEPYQVKTLGESADFNEVNLKKITDCINDVLKAEAPVSVKLLAKKVCSCWDITRMTAPVKSVFDTALATADAETVTHGENDYVWMKGQERDSYDICRTVGNDSERRDIADIAPEEIGVGIKRIMARQVAMTRDDLLRETAHLFGYTRMSAALETAVALGIKSAKNRGWIAFDEDGRIVSC